ncbi:MAG: SpoIIE family protein phosphatase, partial [Oscillospiraceae bacterium]|nr:SpoIIE family protein phosphatase [Oscillospiraceae bacterium]
NFVLAGMNGIPYRKNELQLRPGDELFLYTDGVTEAQDTDKRFFGGGRLLASLNGPHGKNPEDVCGKVLADVNAFAGGSDQFDDITVLCVKFSGRPKRSTLRLTPCMETIGQAADFLERELRALDVPVKASRKMKIALDEIYSNIVKYSGADSAELQCGAENGVLTLRFSDNGIPYDPLEAEMPDTSLPAQERDAGGVGVLMVRRLMDSVEYVHRDGRNVLTLKLSLREDT